MTEVVLDVTDGVALVTLNAPQRRNAMTADMARLFSQTLHRVEQDEVVRAVVVTGAGEAFCAGADRALLARAGEDPLGPASREDINAVYQAFVDLGTLSLPTIAAVNGPAVGAGVNLAMAATLRVVSDRALFISGFHAIGIHPGGGHLHLIARAGGREAAAAMGLFGIPVDGAGAVVHGLAWELVGPERLVERAIQIADGVARDRELVQATLASFDQTAEISAVGWITALELERGKQQWSMGRPSPARRREQ